MGGMLSPFQKKLQGVLQQPPGPLASQPGGAAQVPYGARPPAPLSPNTGTVGRPVTGDMGVARPPAWVNANPTIPAPQAGGGPAAPAPSAPAPAPAAPAAAPVSTSSSSSSGSVTTGLYGRGGGTSAQADPASLEGQLRSYITNGMTGVTSKGFVDRAKAQLGAATEGGRAVAANQINDDAIRRGLFRSGIPAEATAAAGRAAQSNFATGLTDILSKAEQQDIEGRNNAASVASNLLGENRQWDAQEQARQEAAAARAAASAPKTFQYIDPDTGQAYTMDESWF